MRVPLSWLLEYAAIGAPGEVDADEVARRLTACGLEIETIERVGQDITGVVVAQVLEVAELTGFKKPVRYCQVSTGDGAERHVICGATNFRAGDRVPLALPGATLPGGFEIAARKTYGKISEGMICAADELGVGDDHSGIMVLPPDAPLGRDFAEYAGLRDVVLDVNVTPDKGFALSVRGMARELAISYGVPYTDPADAGLHGESGLLADPAMLADAGLTSHVARTSAEVWPASIEDPTACDRFVLREVRGIDPARPTPLWMRVRLARAGQRSVSLAVDVTNYLMLETGQPLHAFDRAALSGPIVVRRARPGEQLETLDHVVRTLDPEDILITDSSGPISLAGTMGGLATEVTPQSADLVIEAAHFSARGTARMSRRHRLTSEAAARFERGVDYELQLRASARAVAMLAELAGGTIVPGCSYASAPVEPVTIVMGTSYPDQVAGMTYGRDTVSRAAAPGGLPGDRRARGGRGQRRRSRRAGRAGPGGRAGRARPPRARPARPVGADAVGAAAVLAARPDRPGRPGRGSHPARGLSSRSRSASRAPRPGRGLTRRQRLRRTTGRVLAAAGLTEVTSSSFATAADFDRLLLPEGDDRRHALVIANPISEDEPLLRTTLLPGLLKVVARNIGRGFSDLALFETGLVIRPGPGGPRTAPILPVDRAPTEAELSELAAALPDQPLHLAVAVTGSRELPGWWGGGRAAGWQDAIEAARQVLRVSGVSFEVRADQPGAVASGPLRGAVRDRRERPRVAGRARRRAAPAGDGRLRPAAAHSRRRAGHVGHRDRR